MGDLFRPPIADMKQTRGYASWRNVTFEGDALPGGGDDDTIAAAVIGIGIDYGIWRRSRKLRCNGIQVNLVAGIFSQFNLDADSDALINSDFIVGPSLTYRRGRFSTRFRLYHQSSHLGDELILQNPNIDRINLSFEVVDFLVSYEGPWWRVYGGAGYLMGGEESDLDPGIGMFGFEYRSPKLRGKVRLTPVVAVNVDALEARDWETTTSAQAGIEMSNPTGTRRYRVLLSYLDGFAPFGQFFNTEPISNYGVTLQFDL